MDLVTLLVLVAIVAVGVVAASSFLNVKPVEEPVKKEKVKKVQLSKTQKIAARAAQASKKTTAKVEEEVEVASAKAEKKRMKEKERKIRKKAEAVAAEALEQAEQKKAEQSKAVSVPVPEPEAPGKKKKKKGKKKKADEGEAPVDVDVEVEVVASPVVDVDDGWVKIERAERAKPIVEETWDAPTDGKVKYEFKIDMMIETENFAVVIGKKGATLTTICEATDTDIKLPKKGVRDYTWISGHTAESVAQAKEALQELCIKGYCSITDPGRVDDGVDVPKDFLGAIMGKGGDTISKLQLSTNTRIDLPGREDASTWVKVVGEAGDVQRACVAIREIMSKGYSAETHPGWETKVIQVPRDQLRNIIGERGATIREIQTSTDTKIDIASKDTADPVAVTVSGLVNDIDEAISQVQGKIVVYVEPETPWEWTREAVLNCVVVF